MTTSPPVKAPGRLRPLNIARDLSAVADLVELCFRDTMDEEGRGYVRQMRRASRDKAFLRWASLKIESVSMPLSGYVWEEDGRIVGNVSLVPFRRGKRKIYLIANVAVAPELRRKGIARALTLRAVEHAQRANAAEIWLHVREENLGAIHLYETLGFVQRARRATWRPEENPRTLGTERGIQIVPRRRAYWNTQLRWLEETYPASILWYHYPDWRIFGTGARHWIHRLFVENDLRQWAVVKDDALQGVLSWQPSLRRFDPIFLAAAPDADSDAIRALLLYARWQLGRRRLTLDYPAGKDTEALLAAGFRLRHTLVWMQAEKTILNSKQKRSIP